MTPLPVERAGVFETLLVHEGRPVELDAHLERMAASLHAVLGAELPERSAEIVREHAAGVTLGRLRLTVAPPERSVRVAEVAGALVFPGWERALALRPLAVPGGIGAHKWADRRLLAAAEADAGPGALPLVVDADGTVLEGSRGNLFLVRDGALLTPRADGRLLPGITRRRVIALAEEAAIDVREAVVALDDLLAADEVFLTGAVRGIEPVRALDRGPHWAQGPIAPLLADRLRRLWGCLPAEEGSR